MSEDEKTVKTLALLQALDNAVQDRVVTARAEAEAIAAFRKAQQTLQEAQAAYGAAVEGYNTVRRNLADILKQDKT